MRYIRFLVLFTFIPWLSFCQDNNSQLDREIIRGEFKCSSINDSQIDRNAIPPPIWTDIRLNSNREKIVKEGAYLALKKLECSLKVESNFFLFFNHHYLRTYDNGAENVTYTEAGWGDGEIPLSMALDISYENEIQNCRGIYSLQNYWCQSTFTADGPCNGFGQSSTRNRVYLNILYRKAPGGYNLQGRMTPRLEIVTATGGGAKGYSSDGWDSTYNKTDNGEFNRIKEVVFIDIEIFDIIFRTKELWIPSEKRWAKSALEAVVYLVIHEMAHVENFLYNSSKFSNYYWNNHGPAYDLYPFDDTEDAAWEYASTILHFTCD